MFYSRSLAILFHLVFIHPIFAQLCLSQRSCGSQTVPSNPSLANGNNSPVGNNIPTAAGLPFINSLPAENNSPVNRLQILTGLQFLNGLSNDMSPNTALTQNGILRLGDLPAVKNLPAFNNLPANNIMANNNLPICNLPATSKLSNLQGNNFPVTPNSQQVDGVSFGNTLVINGLANNGLPTMNGALYNNGAQNINGISNIQNLNEFPNNSPKVARNLLLNGLLPVVNTNLLNNFLENNAIMNSSPSAGKINNEMQLATLLANNLQGNNGLPNNGLPNNGLLLNSGLSLGAQVASNVPVNVPSSISIADNLLVPGIPTSGLNALAVNNFNKIQTNNVLPIPNTVQSPFNNVLQFTNPTANNADNCQNNLLNNGQPFLTNLANSNLFVHNQPANNLISNNLPGSNLITNNFPGNNCGNNFNVPSSLLNLNMLNLGELGNLPILSGLPVIGITETVTVINTAPCLIL